MAQATISTETLAEQTEAPNFSSLRLGDNAAARALLKRWMEDESGYDEKVWPLVKKVIEENRLSERSRFAE